MFDTEDQELIKEIIQLKKEKNAIILAHNYQLMEVQKVADFIGDSLQLAQMAKQVKADMIIFAGVRFMAEAAKLLNPETKVLLTAKDAGCPMADMIEPFQLQEFKAKHPDYLIVCYVNSSVEIKALCDVCVTSSNAVKIVNQLDPNQPIMFVPDQNLGQYTALKSNRNIKVWDGFCPIHHFFFTLNDIERVRREYPDHLLVVHPECKPEIIEKADMACSTKGMADLAEERDHLILGTEMGLVEALQSRFPQKSIIPLSKMAVCVNMKKTRLVDVRDTLLTERNEITIAPDIAKNAVRSINKMLELS